MPRLWSVTLAAALCAAPLPAFAAPFQVAEAVHPYTQQLHAEWLTRLGAAEAASRPNGNLEAAQAAISGLDSWFLEKKQTLERHPDYKAALVRQLTLRVKLARITAVGALQMADLGVSRKDAAFFSDKDGAYERMARADALAESIAAHTGKEQDVYTGLVAFLDQVRGKLKEKAAQVQVGGVGTVLPAGTRLHSFTVQTFNTWLENMQTDEGVAASRQPLATKIKELENGRRWFQSSQQELKKHPGYSQGMARMAGILLTLGELKTQQAVAFAEEGLKAMNVNQFSESAGTYQLLREAERLLVEGRVKGEQSAEYRRLVKAIADAGVAIGKLSAQYNQKAAAAFRLPADQYAAGDKGQLKAMVQSKWQALYPQDQVLDVRFPKGAWERRKEANWNNGDWYFYDNSALLMYVVVKKSAELATVYPVYVNKNHQNGAIQVGAETKGSGYAHQDMLVKNMHLTR